MKKILYILLALSLSIGYSCSSDDKEDEIAPPEPKYFNPIEGEWIWDRSRDTYKRIYTKEFQCFEEWFENGEWGHRKLLGTYTINETTIRLSMKNYKYIISDDILTLQTTDGSENYTRYKE